MFISKSSHLDDIRKPAVCETRFELEWLCHLVRFPDNKSYLVDRITSCVAAKAYKFKILWNSLPHPSSFTIILWSLHSNALHVDFIRVNESDRLNSEAYCFIYVDLDISNFITRVKFSLLPFPLRLYFRLNLEAWRFVVEVKLQPTKVLRIVELVAYSLNPNLILKFFAMFKYSLFWPACSNCSIRMSYGRKWIDLTWI